jgi:hypothetical protein
MTDEQAQAEALDDDVIADDELIDRDAGATGDDRFVEYPALDEEYPPEEPMGVEDLGRFDIEDDVASREERKT